MRTFSLPINGMTCGGCAAAVTKALQKVPGVLRVEVHLAEQRALITANEQLQQSALDDALNRAGFRRGSETAQA
jgi:P-type Cu+ transporter